MQDGFVDKISSHAKLRLTVPREPDLVTAHRAQRMRFVLLFKILRYQVIFNTDGQIIDMFITQAQRTAIHDSACTKIQSTPIEPKSEYTS